MSTTEQLKALKPGVNYPNHAFVDEMVAGQRVVIKFNLQSYVSGMYAAIYADNQLVSQTGDHNNKSFVTRLKNDLKRAIERGAKVELGQLVPIKTF